MRLRSASFVALAGALGITLFAGCGGNSASTSTAERRSAPEESRPPRTGQPKPPAGEAVVPAAAPGRPTVRTDARGRKWIGEIPLDVWFDDPLGVAANTNPIASTADAVNRPAPDAPEPPRTTTGDGASPTGSGGTDWTAIVPMPIIDAEVKTIRNELTQSLQSLGKYNGNYKEIQSNGATLAALAAIAQGHSDAVSWKEHARHVRELGTRMNLTADALGRSAFEATQLPFEQLVAILNGSRPPDLPADTPETAPLGDAADRFGVMRRMDKSFQFLRKNINTEQALQKEKDSVLHEAAILTALARAISDKSYGSADEEEYATAARGLIEAGLTMQEAARGDDFSGFGAALGAAEKRCNECHQGYRFADDF